MDIYTSVRDLDWNNPLIVAMASLFVIALSLATICLILALTERTGRQHRALQVCAVISTLLLTTGFGLAIHVVHKARQAFLDSYLTDNGTLWYESINTIEPVLSAVGWALGGVSLLGGSTLGLLVRRSPDMRMRMPVGLFVTCFLLCFITALGIGLRLSHIGNAPSISSFVDPEVHWAIKHGDHAVMITRGCVLAIAIIATMVISVQAFRGRNITRESVSYSLWILGIFIAAIGSHAWLRTRPLAFDAREPLSVPPHSPFSLCPKMSLDAAKLPLASPNETPCVDYDFHNYRFGIVELGATGASSKGEVATTPDELRRMIEKQLDADPTFHYGHLLLAADAAMPEAERLRWLAAIPRRVWTTRLMGYGSPAQRPTHAAGVILRRPRCACRPVEPFEPFGRPFDAPASLETQLEPKKTQ